MEVEYDTERWTILAEKREKARRIILALTRSIQPDLIVVHGSVARGDVTQHSDVDIAIVEPVAPGIVEEVLRASGIPPYKKMVIQATPRSTPKAYFILKPDESEVVSVPLSRLQPREREFYAWGGEANIRDLMQGKRVPGVSKELKLIIPNEKGHVEEPVIGNEGRTASILNISQETVMERVRILTRRREHGKTGVYMKVEVPSDEPVEYVVRELLKRNKHFRRALQP